MVQHGDFSIRLLTFASCEPLQEYTVDGKTYFELDNHNDDARYWLQIGKPNDAVENTFSRKVVAYVNETFKGIVYYSWNAKYPQFFPEGVTTWTDKLDFSTNANLLVELGKDDSANGLGQLRLRFVTLPAPDQASSQSEVVSTISLYYGATTTLSRRLGLVPRFEAKPQETSSANVVAETHVTACSLTPRRIVPTNDTSQEADEASFHTEDHDGDSLVFVSTTDLAEDHEDDGSETASLVIVPNDDFNLGESTVLV